MYGGDGTLLNTKFLILKLKHFWDFIDQSVVRKWKDAVIF